MHFIVNENHLTIKHIDTNKCYVLKMNQWNKFLTSWIIIIQI